MNNHTNEIAAQNSIRKLLNEPDWIDKVCSWPDRAEKRMALYACARVVLPYWQSRFDDDERMEILISKMCHFISGSNNSGDRELKSAIPKRERMHWDLSPPAEYEVVHSSNCPADFAGDSIYYAANAMLDEPPYQDDDCRAFSSAVECVARLLFERDGENEQEKDYVSEANRYLLEKMIETLDQE